MASITGSILNKAEPISFGQYITEFDRLQEKTSSGHSDTTPEMVKIEALYPELSEIGWRRFNFPWCTGYSHKQYKKGLDLIIHKYPNDCGPHRPYPILLFGIEANMHNKALGRYAINQ